jgi:hypothetical protein
MINPLEDRHLKLLAVMQQLLADIRSAPASIDIRSEAEATVGHIVEMRQRHRRSTGNRADHTQSVAEWTRGRCRSSTISTAANLPARTSARSPLPFIAPASSRIHTRFTIEGLKVISREASVKRQGGVHE